MRLDSSNSLPELTIKEQTALSPKSSPLHEASNLEGVLDGAQQVCVCEAFAGRTVLLTGVTGFVGSLVLEQLLRTCPDVHKVFVIVRQKHSISGPDRVQNMLHSHPLYHLVRAQMHLKNSVLGVQDTKVTAAEHTHRLQPNCFPQVEVLAGDMTLPGYGVDRHDMHRLKQETEIVIHAAASISFDDHIHDAVTHNYMVRATGVCCAYTLLPFAFLLAFVHHACALATCTSMMP